MLLSERSGVTGMSEGGLQGQNGSSETLALKHLNSISTFSMYASAHIAESRWGGDIA